MRRAAFFIVALAAALATVLAAVPAQGQVLLTGRILKERFPGSTEPLPFTGILAFASLAGSASEAISFRTWETQPSGWYRLSGGAGRYAICFTNPASFLRPILLTNVYTEEGLRLDRNLEPRFDYGDFSEAAWDREAATDYIQPFTARGTGVTQVGFRLAHDGTDGAGPGKQDLVVCIRRRGPGAPDAWEQVGPAVTVPEVDSGGAKNYLWSAGWNSGEAPTIPGEVYAVHLRAAKPGGAFQPFWREIATGLNADCCYRIGPSGKSYAPRRLWMAVSSDGDGLLIPYNKRVHKQFVQLTRLAKKWSQTYVAQGRGLAAVVLYAAVSGKQPPLSRQRARVRLRKGGPDGPAVGTEKIAIGNGNYTGDASWGTFGAVFAPGEAPLEPGALYAIELESIETEETIGGFVNIKGEVSDGKPGFNPYRKHPLDVYEGGMAYWNGTEAVEYDLDLQVIEYAHHRPDWAEAVEGDNLLDNGDLQKGELVDDRAGAGGPAGWGKFSILPETALFYIEGKIEPKRRFARVAGGKSTGKPADGGYVQRVAGLKAAEVYRLGGRVRGSHPAGAEHQCLVGIDPTGQTDNPQAPTIRWTVHPGVHGFFEAHRSAPIRTASDAISIWLRGKTGKPADFPFQADFEGFSLQRIPSGIPGAPR